MVKFLGNSSDLGDYIWAGLVIVAVIIVVSGLFLVATANYFANPVQAFEQQTTGLLAIFVGLPILLVLIGGAAVVAAVLGAILSLFNRDNGNL